MRLSAGIKEEDKDKGIEIISSILKNYIYDFFNEEKGEQLHLTFLKDEICVLYSLSTGEYTKDKAMYVEHHLKEFKKKLIKQQDTTIIKQYNELVKTINTRLKMYV